jgi:perosamine synthetase
MSGRAQSLRQNPPARRRHLSHLPPTAFPVSGADVWAGLSAQTPGRHSIDRFRSQIAQQTGSTYCQPVSSGRAALALTLMGLKRILDRSHVIVPAYGCPTVAQSVLRAGLEPVICDLSPQTLAFDLEALKHKIDGNTLAVVPAHLYGWAHDVTDLSTVAAEHGSYVVEDAAQAFGAAWNGRMVGTWGDAGFYSFGRGKCLPAGGGGAIVAKAHCAGAIEEVVRAEASEPPGTDTGALLRLVGYSLATRPFAWWFVVRTPLNPAYDGRDVASLPPIRLQRLSSSLAAIGSSMLGRLGGVQAVCRRNARRLMDLLTGFAFVQVPTVSCEAVPVYLRLPVLVDSRARASRLFDLLAREGIGVSRSYGVTVAELYAGRLPFVESQYPGACRVAQCLLTLPTHAYLGDRDFERIAGAFRAAGHN